MTERLREIVATDDPALAELVRLVRAASDVDPRPGAQDRVRRALAERPAARRRWQTPVLVALLLLVVLPVAIAGVHRLVAPPAPPPIPPAPSSRAPGSPHATRPSAAPDQPAPPPAAPARVDARPEVARSELPASGAPVRSVPRPPAPAVPAPGAQPPSTPPLPVPDAQPRPHLPGPAAAGSTASRHPAVVAPGPRLPIEPAAHPAPPLAPDAALVVGAMRQLRRGHDPRAALRELDAYLDRFPDGDLAEEVLALAIEARTALGDSAAAPLAERYLQRYPHGRFREQAERARQLGEQDRQRTSPGPAGPRSRDR
jgi:hypothetical protein